MDLQNFITEALKQIIEGVKDAQMYLSDNNISATIHPKKSREDLETVDFDVAVTSTENITGGISGGIKVASIFSIGGENKTQTSEQNISRIKFKVKIELPHQNGDNYKDPSLGIPSMVKRGGMSTF